MLEKSSKQLKILGIIIIVLGIIHIMLAPIVLTMFEVLKDDKLKTFVFMYLAAGFGTILPGVIVLTARSGFANNVITAVKQIRMCSIYLSILGLMAVSTMWDNPFSYMTLILGFVLMFFAFFPGATVINKKKIKGNHK
jgi:hypothetical protein